MDLSIVIPVLNESKKIRNDILAASEFLVTNKIRGEIIIVDDGSTDYTAEIARQTEVASGIGLQVIQYAEHRGKGFAVQKGVKHSVGKYVIFMDSGLCVPLHFILDGLNLIEKNECEIAHGSRFLPHSSIVRPHLMSRRISSFLFRKIVKFVMALPSALTDTQCGFKMYQGEIARLLFSQLVTDGFMFDVEIIKRAVENGFRIREFPIVWTADPDSRLSQWRVPVAVFFELIKIKKALHQNKKRIKAA